MTLHAPISPPAAILECRRIVDIATSEMERRRQRADIYGRECIMDLNEIIYAALAIEDWFAGADDVPLELLTRELEALTTEWAETVDYRTFGATPAIDALDMGPTWQMLAQEGRSQQETL